MSRSDKGKLKQELLFDFRPPKLNLDLAIGHKHGAWYLIFARNYCLVDSREVTRLDEPGLPNRKDVGGHPCFWFNPKAFSGWEQQNQSLLELLLSFDRSAVLKVIPPTRSVPGALTEVEVLIPEAQLAHCCESCETWESIESDSRRWTLVRPGRFPEYLCPDCYAKDWWGRRLGRAILRMFCYL